MVTREVSNQGPWLQECVCDALHCLTTLVRRPILMGRNEARRRNGKRSVVGIAGVTAACVLFWRQILQFECWLLAGQFFLRHLNRFFGRGATRRRVLSIDAQNRVFTNMNRSDLKPGRKKLAEASSESSSHGIAGQPAGRMGGAVDVSGENEARPRQPISLHEGPWQP